MQIHDQGTKKWVSMMLPEHMKMLQEAFMEYKEKPILDEQQMIEMDMKLKYALENKLDIEMTYYRHKDFHTSQGKLEKIDQWRGFILLLSEDGFHIPLADLIDVEVLESVS